MTKKTIYLLLFLLLSVNAAWAQDYDWSNFKADAFAGGTGSASDPYLIKNAAQFAYFANKVSTGTSYQNSYVALGANINLTDHEWLPIGSLTDQNNNVFRGTFDGQGFMISNMHVDCTNQSSNEQSYGLFSTLGANSAVRNLIIEGASLTGSDVNASINVGVIAGIIANPSAINNVIIKDSEININSQNSSNENAQMKVGGVVGRLAKQDNNQSIYLQNISSDVDITVVHYKQSWNKSISWNIFVGGLTANWMYWTETRNISNIYIQGTINSEADNKATFYPSGETNSLNNTSNNLYATVEGTGVSAQGTAKEEDFTSEFVTIINQANENNDDLLQWSYNNDKLDIQREALGVEDVDASQRGLSNHTMRVTGKDVDKFTYEWYRAGSSTPLPTTGTGVECEVMPSYTDEPLNIVVKENGTEVTTITTTCPTAYFEGDGLPTSPFQISSKEELVMMAYIINNAPTASYITGYSQAYYELTDNIDLSSIDNFTPIGAVKDKYLVENCFRGHFDGKGFTISGLKETWTAGDINEDRNRVWGLFGAVQGNNAEYKAVIENLVVSGAVLKHNTSNTSFYYNNGTSGNSHNCFVGIVAGVVGNYTTIQNVEVRNCTITDNGSSEYKIANRNLSVGGIVGRVQQNFNVWEGNLDGTIKLQYLSSDCGIEITKAAFTTNNAQYQRNINVAGIVASMLSTGASSTIPWPEYTYYTGKMNVTGKGMVSPLFSNIQYEGNATDGYEYYCRHYMGANAGNENSFTGIYYGTGFQLYYSNAWHDVNNSYPASVNNKIPCDMGARTIVAHAEYSMKYVIGDWGTKWRHNNSFDDYAYQGVNYGTYVPATDRAGVATAFNNAAALDGYSWTFSDDELHFSQRKEVILSDDNAGNISEAHTLTAKVMGMSGSYTLKWFNNDQEVAGQSGTTYQVTPNTHKQFIKCQVWQDGSQVMESNTVEVCANFVSTPQIEKDLDADPSGRTLKVVFKPTDYPSGYTITYQWKDANKVDISGATGQSYATPQNALYYCEVKVTDSYSTTTYLLSATSGARIVYLNLNNGNDSNDGSSSNKAVKTWAKAYEKLAYGPNAKRLYEQWKTHGLNDGINKKNASYILTDDTDFTGSVDNNIIYLVGNNSVSVSNTQFEDLVKFANNGGNETGNYTDCLKRVLQSGLMKPATISGKNASGSNVNITVTVDKGLTLNEDTRFEYVTFKPSANNNAPQILCAYYDLEMGDNVQMSGIVSAANGDYDTGCAEGAKLPNFLIFGGYQNDTRFSGMNGGVSNFDYYLPHGEEGFKIKIKSGYYSTICPGGKQWNVTGLNGVMGSPNVPIKCTIEVDIDRSFNDSHSKPITGNVTATHDIGAVLAGNHEGAMYGDVDIIIRSGKVSRVVNGTLGAQRNVQYQEKNASGGSYSQTSFPYDSFFGRANILIDPASSTKNTAEDINSRVTVTELYGGGLGRNFEDGTLECKTFFYGKSSVTVKGGTFESALYAAGAGGVNGIGNYTYSEFDGNNEVTKTIVTNDDRLPYWEDNKKHVLYGNATAFLNSANKVKVKCYNPEDGSHTEIDLEETSATIDISGGKFGTSAKTVGIYGGGYGFANKKLIPFDTKASAIPNKMAGGMLGKTGSTVSTLNITGGEIYGNVYGAGAGTGEYYTTTHASNRSKDLYKELALVTGNVVMNIGGDVVIHGDVYGASQGVDNANLPNMAHLYGNVNLTIEGNATIDGNIYGGGQNGSMTGSVTLNIDGDVTVGKSAGTGNIYGAGLGTNNLAANVSGSSLLTIKKLKYGDESDKYIYGGGNVNSTVGGLSRVFLYSILSKNGQTTVYGGGNGQNTTCQNTIVAIRPLVQPEGDSNLYGFGDLYGGGNSGTVTGKATIELYGGTILGNVFGGGNEGEVGTAYSDLTRNDGETDNDYNSRLNNYKNAWRNDNGTTVSMVATEGTNAVIYGNIFGGGNKASVHGNTSVAISSGTFGGEVFGGGNGDLTTNPITYANVTGNTAVYVNGANVIWDKLWDKTSKQFKTYSSNKDLFVTDATEAHPYIVFKNNHNIYGGGNNACQIGIYDNNDNIMSGTGESEVKVTKGFCDKGLLSDDAWLKSMEDDQNPHFYVFGGGYGARTRVGTTTVNVGISMSAETETAETTDQLVRGERTDSDEMASANKAGGPNKAPAIPSESVSIMDNTHGIPGYTVLGVIGGGYAGLVKQNTNVTVGGDTYVRRIFGGGFGQKAAFEALAAGTEVAPSKTRDNLGEVGGYTIVNVNGGMIYGDVFGGGAGVESSGSAGNWTDYPAMGRVVVGTAVNISDKAKIYGDVHGGGDVANVGIPDSVKLTVKPRSSEEVYNKPFGKDQTSSGYDPWTRNTISFVEVSGGMVFGSVYAGGNGRKKAQANDYTQLGRVEGNAMVHVYNGNNGANVPYLWDRIFGGGSYGTVNGNTLVHIEGGMLGNNIFGGGYGDVISSETDNALGVLDGTGANSYATYANVLGNTKVKIDGGSWLWNQYADEQGNIITWTDATRHLANSFDEIKATLAQNPAALYQMIGSTDANFFDFWKQSFRHSHNIYGGGNRACIVGTYTNQYEASSDEQPAENTGKAEVIINHSPLTKIQGDRGVTINMLDPTTVAGMCWYRGVDNTASPQFSVFGAGYGVNTKVGSTDVYVGPGVQAGKTGAVIPKGTGNAKGYYAEWKKDSVAYVELELDINRNFADPTKVTDESLKRLYGSHDGTRDATTFLRYRASYLAWSLGCPNLTFMDVHGGGYGGYVANNCEVRTDCMLAVRSVFGGGLGAVPLAKDIQGNARTITGNETSGQVGGNTLVKIFAGFVSLNVFGGGSGVESILKADSTYLDFENIARVKGKSKVEVYGENVTKTGSTGATFIAERTLVYGSIYGGGDVANVGTTANSTKQQLKGDAGESYTTEVGVYGGSVLSQVYAAGKGRLKSECKDYTKLGGVYGNTHLEINKTQKAYPDYDLGADEGAEWQNAPYMFNRLYGGGQNGVVYGNTLVEIKEGNIVHNVFGGGWGNVTQSAKGEILTSADVKGNTNIRVTGGSITLTSMWEPTTRSWSASNLYNGKLYSPQYDPVLRKFVINHNIYGGGNLVCEVGGNSYVTMTKGLLGNQQTVSGVAVGDKGVFGTNEWEEVYHKTGSSHFSVLGGGYGDYTNIEGDTYVNIELASQNEKTIVNAGGLEDANLIHQHFHPGMGLLDVVGGGYSGAVKGTTHVNVGGETFLRRVFGGGFFAPVGAANVKINAVDCADVFGGGQMGDVGYAVGERNYDASLPHMGEATVTLGYESGDKNADGSDASNRNGSIWIHKNVYGGNDTSGSIRKRCNVNLLGGHVLGNVYGAGNGDYLYALGKDGEKKVTVNEYYMKNETTGFEGYDLVYTVPMRSDLASAKSASPAQKIVNINTYRPVTPKTNLLIKGNSTTDKVYVVGNVYGGGSSATIHKIEEGDETSVDINICNHVELGEVYMGSDGENLFVNQGGNSFLHDFQEINGLSLEDPIDWMNDPSNHSISTNYLNTELEQRSIIYPHLLDLYFQPVEMDVQAKLLWNGTMDGSTLEDCTIGTFCCGGNHGNMNIYPDADGKVLEYTFPAGLTITNKIVGGCNNANYEWYNSASGLTTIHEGGYLLGTHGSAQPMIKLNIQNTFSPSAIAKEDYYESGLNVYGGCYYRGTIRGDVTIDFRSNILGGLDMAKLKKSNEMGKTVGNIYGAGYGTESYVYGDINLLFSKGVTNASANYVYGGAQQGNVIGNTYVRILNGTINKSITGGSYAGYQWGSTHVLVGYPKYYKALQTGKYHMIRTDKAADNLALKNSTAKDYDKPDAQINTVKQHVWIQAGDYVSQQVYEAIDKIDDNDISGNKAPYFGTLITETPEYGNKWNDVNITIGEAVYGGGYSLTTGTSQGANNTTVLKYTDEVNEGEETIGYGGNTTMLIYDHPEATDANDANYTDKEHITISSQEMKEVSVPAGTDYYGYYYKSIDGKYHFIFQSGRYHDDIFPDKADAEHKLYEFDGEGGIFGDGHLSYAEGFRNAELTGYGYAQHTVTSPKIVNTFQRMDMLRLTDNCFNLLGARDYTVNEISSAPYSIARVGEVQMVSTLDANNMDLSITHSEKRIRNFMGFSNNIKYVGALSSNAPFTERWHDSEGKGKQENDQWKTYKDIKQEYITRHNEALDNHQTDLTFVKRNDGTAKNMIGIASGYALKIQNVQEQFNGGFTTETLYYGPVQGIMEIDLIDIREDEGGGYVYADNIHDENNFMETTGNFVFPYNANDARHVEDDCFPAGYDATHDSEGHANQPTHYWYVTGYNYFYNARITGYTYDSSSDGGINFDLANTDGLIKLDGATAGLRPRIASINWQTKHKAEGYTCDFETKGQEDQNNPEGHYWLGICTSSDGKYNEEGPNFNLPFVNPAHGTTYHMDQNLTEPAPSIGMRLHDQVNNSGTEYFNKHLSEPCAATIVLALDTLDAEGHYVPKYAPGYVGIQNFFTYNESTKEYVQVAAGTKITVNTNNNEKYYYYNNILDLYKKISDITKVCRKVNEEYQEIGVGGELEIGAGKVYYFEKEREYTYTIYLTIDYVQGPSVTGNVTINNCALPGEMIRLSTENVHIEADETLAPEAYYWRIGPVETVDGVTRFVNQGDTVWNKNDLNNMNRPYETYKVGSDIRQGLFKNCYYDKTNNALDVPAFYFMNGYGVQYGFTVNGLDYLFPVQLREQDTLVVHNYHMMDSHSAETQEGSKVDLHLSQAVARAKKEPGFRQPRIYLTDNKDLVAFVTFLNTVGTDGDFKTSGKEMISLSGNQMAEVPRYGEYAQFIVQNNLEIPSTYRCVDDSKMKGTVHGQGYVISGLNNKQALIESIEGNIYNLGLQTGRFSKNGSVDGKIANYHCCYEFSDGNSQTPRKVYDADGTIHTDYSVDDFRYGRVGYDLNQYYQDKKKENPVFDYVENYFKDGDYQYARRQDADTKHETGALYLRTGATTDVPNYGSHETRHNTSHTKDTDRAVMDEGGNFLYYAPLFNRTSLAEEGTAQKNDYIFFGQALEATPDIYPSAIKSRLISAAHNRIWRVGGYYGSKVNRGFHFNAVKQENITIGTYVHAPLITAIDFTDDSGEQPDQYASFLIGNSDISRNLLVYTAKGTAAGNEAYDVVNALLTYDENTDETGIKGHHLVKNDAGAFEIDRFHLIERATESDANNNFNAPIAFNVKTRAWYTRKPAGYAQGNNAAWEGICLPFSVNKVEAEYNGELSHFYAADLDPDKGGNNGNLNNVGHEYWLRGLTAVTMEDGTATASFKRPGAGYFEGGTLKGKYNYYNEHFSKVYGSSYQSGNIYKNTRVYNDYYFQQANIPYLTSFPGSSYKEFDLSGTYNQFMIDGDHSHDWNADGNVADHSFPQLTEDIAKGLKVIEAQNVTFSWMANNDRVEGTGCEGVTTIHVTDDITAQMTTTANGFTHQGTFLAMDEVPYGIDSKGNAFDEAETNVLPFRTYMTKPNIYGVRGYINIGGEESDEIDEDDEDEDDEVSEGLIIYPEGNRIVVKSNYQTRLKVYTPAGQLVDKLNVNPGTNTYKGYAPGIYIVGKKKLSIGS